MGRIGVVTNFKKFWKISAIESVFSKVPNCKLHTWVRVISTTHASLEIKEQQFFETFQSSYFNYLARPFSLAFARHHTFLAVFTFLNFCVCVYLSLQHCLKGKFNFWIAFNFRYSGGALRTPVKDLRWSFL